MKKTVIIAIILVYLASIVMVQLFGIPVAIPPGGSYISGIEITGVRFANDRTDEIRSKVQTDGVMLYAFPFISSDEEYTLEEESVEKNPNRLKVDYILSPEDASKDYLLYTVDNNSVIFLRETDELIFLKKGLVNFTLKESTANLDVQYTIRVMAY